MILTVNIGNTHITVGGYEQDTLIFCGRLHSDPAATVEEYAIRLVNLLQLYGASPAQIEGGILGSVVPMLSGRVLAALHLLCKARILTVGPGLKSGIKLRLDNPAQLGAELLCGAVAALAECPGPLVVISADTAISLMAVNAKQELVGGAEALLAVEHALVAQAVVLEKEVVSAHFARNVVLGVVPQLGETAPDFVPVRNLCEVVLRHLVLGTHPRRGFGSVVILHPAVGILHPGAEIVVYGGIHPCDGIIFHGNLFHFAAACRQGQHQNRQRCGVKYFFHPSGIFVRGSEQPAGNKGSDIHRKFIYLLYGQQSKTQRDMYENLKKEVELVWEDHDHIRDDQAKIAIRETVRLLDEGQIRVANPNEDGSWSVNEWVKKAILLYFPIQRVETQTAGPMEYNDKIPLKNGFDRLGVRVVPPAVARYGAYLAPGSILMPCYVNIGAYVDTGSLVDTWATVGSCAQIGKNVHLSGGVGIGGVLEPIQGSPVIIEDECFIGSRCIVVEGAHIRKGAVLGAGVVITGSTKIIDVSGPEPVEYRGEVPERSVVIPGTLPKKFPAGQYDVPCALIIGKRKASTDAKTTLNDALRTYDVMI